MTGERNLSDDGCLLFDMREGKVLAEGQWHRWFAWRPVWTIHTGWTWLSSLERQFTRMSRPSGVTTYVTYYRPAQTTASQSQRKGQSDGGRDEG